MRGMIFSGFMEEHGDVTFARWACLTTIHMCRDPYLPLVETAHRWRSSRVTSFDCQRATRQRLMLQFISFHFNRCKEYDNDEHTTTPSSVAICHRIEIEERGKRVEQDNHTYVGIGTLFCHLSSPEHVTHDDESASFLIHLSPSLIQDDDHLFPHIVVSTFDCVATARKRLEWTAFITSKKRWRHHQTLLPHWSCNCLSRHGSIFISKPSKRCNRQRRRADRLLLRLRLLLACPTRICG